MKDIDEVSDIIDLLGAIGFHVQQTEHLIEEAYKKIKEFDHAIKEILKFVRNRRQADCDKALNVTNANLERMIKLIDRYEKDIKHIEDDQDKLRLNGFADMEKDRDIEQFGQVIGSRKEQIGGYGKKRDDFKIQIEALKKQFEDKKKNGDPTSSGAEFLAIQKDNDALQALILKEIQGLEGQVADDIQAAKEENTEFVRKHQYKLEKHG